MSAPSSTGCGCRLAIRWSGRRSSSRRRRPAVWAGTSVSPSPIRSPSRGWSRARTAHRARARGHRDHATAVLVVRFRAHRLRRAGVRRESRGYLAAAGRARPQDLGPIRRDARRRLGSRGPHPRRAPLRRFVGRIVATQSRSVPHGRAGDRLQGAPRPPRRRDRLPRGGLRARRAADPPVRPAPAGLVPARSADPLARHRPKSRRPRPRRRGTLGQHRRRGRDRRSRGNRAR